MPAERERRIAFEHEVEREPVRYKLIGLISLVDKMQSDFVMRDIRSLIEGYFWYIESLREVVDIAFKEASYDLILEVRVDYPERLQFLLNALREVESLPGVAGIHPLVDKN